jgi:hypothetical protein
MSDDLDLGTLIADGESSAANPAGNALVFKLAKDLLASRDRVADLEKKVKEEQAKGRLIAENELPKALREAGVKKLTMDDGSVIEMTRDTYASITKANEDEAFKYLIDTGSGAIIEPEITIPFAKGDLAKAGEVLTELKKSNVYGADVALGLSIHWQTLRAYARDQLDKEHDVPENERKFPEKLFGVYTVDRADVTAPKKTRARSKKE